MEIKHQTSPLVTLIENAQILEFASLFHPNFKHHFQVFNGFKFSPSKHQKLICDDVWPCPRLRCLTVSIAALNFSNAIKVAFKHNFPAEARAPRCCIIKADLIFKFGRQTKEQKKNEILSNLQNCYAMAKKKERKIIHCSFLRCGKKGT